MSRSRDGTTVAGDVSLRAGAGAGSASVASTVPLPNIPRTTDEKAKAKYINDYEKYEPELRKHHLGGPEASTTIGLKDVAAEFSRTVPSLNEPTAAEREYERCLQLKAKLRQRNRFYRSPGAAKPKNSGTAGAMGSANGARSPTVPPQQQMGESVVAAATTTGATSTTTPADGHPHAAAAATEAAPPVDRSTGDDTTSSGARGKGQQQQQQHGGKMPHRAASPPLAVSAAKHATTPPPPRGRKDRNQTSAATAKQASHGGTAGPTQPSLPPPPSPPPPPRPQRRPLDIEASLREGSPQQPFPFAGRAVSAGAADHPPPPSDVAECAAVLRVLVDTPEEFLSSFQLDTSFFDLGWLKGARSQPPALTTIQSTNFTETADRASSSATGRAKDLLTSPRSVLVMLRSGVAMSDLRPERANAALAKTESGSGSMSDPGQLLPEDAELRGIVKKLRADRDRARREQLLSALQSDYIDLCQQVPLPELVAAFRAISSGDGAAKPRAVSPTGLPTSVAQRIARQQKMFATNKVRLQRQVELMKAVHEREEAAAARRTQAEAEARAAAEHKAAEEAEARALQQERLEAQKRKNAAIEEVYQKQVAERLAKAEVRNQERLEAQAQLTRQRQEQRAAVAAERHERFARNAQLQDAQAAEAEQRRLEKEAKLAELSREREARIADERKELEERQARAAVAREAARRRAEQAQAAVHEAALEKQREVDARLEEFQRRRAEEHTQRVEEEQAREARRLEALASAQQQQQAFRDRTRQRAAEQDAVLEELQHERVLERTIRAEQEREEATLKRYAVQQRQRVDEYGKLRTIAKLLEKRAAADYVTQEREALLKQSLKARDAMNAERERLRKELEVAKRRTNM